MPHIVRRISIPLFLVLLSANLFAQENNEQKLIDLLTSGRFFEAKEFYEQAEKDSVFDPFYSLYYRYEMARMQHRNDSAAVFLEQLLEDGDEYWGGYKFYYYEQLLDLYTHQLQDYKKALFTCDRMQQYLKENPFGVDEENIKNGFLNVQDKKRLILRRERYSTIKSSRKGTDNVVKIKDTNEFIFFDATYNNKTMTTLFDTGSSAYIIMNEKIADSIGVKRVNVFDDGYSHRINNEIVPLDEGIIDSMEIANFKLYNIPVAIYKFDPVSNILDSIDNCNTERREVLEENLRDFSKSMSIVMGYPAMFLMEKITVDFENSTLSLPDNPFVQQTHSDVSNMFVYANGLYTRLSINDIPFTAHVDFGSTSYLQLHSSFYEKNRDKIPLKALEEKKPLNITMLHKTWLNIPYEIPNNPSLRFNGMSIPAKNDNPIEIYSLPNQEVSGAFDGHVGYPFFRDLGKKIVLDFKNMRIDVIE